MQSCHILAILQFAMADPKLTEGTLYINRDRDFRTVKWGEYVKIGIVRGDRNAADRNLEHQTGNPREILTIHELFSPMVEHLETQLHHRFSSCWVHGEWFEIDDETVDNLVLKEASKIIAQQNESLQDFRAKIELKDTLSTDSVRAPNNEEQQVAKLCFDAREALTIASAKKDIIDAKLRIAIGENNGIEGIANLVYKQGSASFDKKKFMKENETLAEQYMEDREDKLSGSISLAKGKSLADLDSELSDALGEVKSEIPKFKAELKSKTPRSMNGLLELHAMYVESMRDVAVASWEFDRMRARLVRLLGNDKGIEEIITYNRVMKEQAPAFNSTRFKKENPEIYQSYLKEGKESVAVAILPYRSYNLDS